MMSPQPPTGTVTLLFTDIEGSTYLWTKYPETMPAALQRHHELLRQAIESNRGYIFQIIGDAFCAAFSSAGDALCATINAQKALCCEPWQEIEPIKVRMALHTGVVEIRAGEFVSGEYSSGLTLSLVARLLSASHGGQVLLSRPTRDLLVYDQPEEFNFRDLGEHPLKGLSKPVQIFQLLHPDLPCDFPPLNTQNAFLNNLPLQTNAFIGRKKEIEAIKKQLSTGRLVTLTGTGGVGKTRLALAAAQELLGEYRNGNFFIPLVSIQDPAMLLSRIAQELGLQETRDQSLQDMLYAFLSTRQFLLVLDNFEQLLPAAPALAKLIQIAPDLHLLVTSRSPLHLSCESVLTIQPLGLPEVTTMQSGDQVLYRIARSESVQLFTRRAKARVPTFRLDQDNGKLIADICQRLDGLPLAMELAAARVREYPLPLLRDEIFSLLDLQSQGFHDLPERQQTLRSTYDWSYNHLDPVEQNLFPHLGVFAGGFNLEAVQAIASSFSKIELLAALGGLVDKSMIYRIAKGDRYSLLQITREYALERLEADGLVLNTRRDHLVYFTRLAEEAAPHLWDKEQREWRQRLTLEIENIRQALQWALLGDEAEVGQVDMAARMAASLWYYWYLLGALYEGQNWLTAALIRTPQFNQTRARVLVAIGTYAWQLGNLPEAASQMQEAVRLFTFLEDQAGLAEANHMYGHVIFDRQQYSEADRIFRATLSMYEAIGDQIIRISLIGDLGLVAFHQGDLKSARKYFEQSLDLSIKNGTRDVESGIDIRLGDADRLEGDYEKAEDFYQKSLVINRDLKIPLEIASSIHKLGFTALQRQEVPKAQSLFLESLALQHEFGNQQGIAECLAGLASVQVAEERYENAARYFGAAHQILIRTGLPMSPADLAEWRRDERTARILCDRERFEKAWACGLKESIDGLVNVLLPGISASEHA